MHIRLFQRRQPGKPSLTSSLQEISSSTMELTISAEELMEKVNYFSEAFDTMNNKMNETENSLEMINSITKGSHLFGLIAGIEAARSGEYGKGFSIVAKEITKLADQRAKSVDHC